MNVIFKSIISVSAIFALIAVIADTPNSIEILGMNVSVSTVILLVMLILTTASTIGIISTCDQSKTENKFFTVIGAISAIVLCRLWLSNIPFGLFIIGFFSNVASLLLGMFFSIWHQVVIAMKIQPENSGVNNLPVAIKAFIRAIVFACVTFLMLLVATAFVSKLILEYNISILLLQMIILFFVPSIYELIQFLIGNYGTDSLRNIYHRKNQKLGKIFVMHDYMLQIGGYAPISNVDPPLIYKYVVQGDLEMVKNRINSGDDLNSKNHVGWTILCQAIADRNHEIATYLLEKGANPNTLNSLGRSPMVYAARYGDTEMIKLLLKFGAKPNLFSQPEKFGPLRIAIIEGHVSVVKLLLPSISLIKDESKEYLEYKLALRTKKAEIIELIAKKINEQGDIETYL